MPPHIFVPTPTDQSHTTESSKWSDSDFSIISGISLLALVLVAGIRWAILKYTSTKRRIPSKSHSNLSSQEKASGPCQPLPMQLPERKKGQRCNSDVQKNTEVQGYKSLYPWIGPPEPLPGPYDPRLYPLPTLRRHSYDLAAKSTTEDASISYTRRVSLNQDFNQSKTVHGMITTSHKGWRRNQWVISGK